MLAQEKQRLDHRYVGALLITGEPTFVEKKYADEYVSTRAAKMSANEKQLYGREPDDVLRCCKGFVVELAMAKMPNFALNPREFDKADPHSYAWDIYHVPSGTTFECKWMQENKDWLSFRPGTWGHIFDYTHLIDYLVAARIDDVGGYGYAVRLQYTMPAGIIKRFLIKGQYDTSLTIVNHMGAYRNYIDKGYVTVLEEPRERRSDGSLA